MIKDRLKYIAAAAFGAGAVLLATGTGTQLIALQGANGGTVRAHASDDRVQVSPPPEVSPSPEPTPEVVPSVTVLAAAPAPDDEANQAVEDAQDANEAAEPADVDDAKDANDVNDDNAAGAAPLGQPVADDHGHDGSGPGGSGSDDHGSGGHGSDDGHGG